MELQSLQTALICAGVFVVSAVVVLLISIFGMKEKTYEEAIEEQRKRNMEAVHQPKSEKPKKEKKYKKWGRRAKEKSSDDDKPLQDEDLPSDSPREDQPDSSLQVVPPEHVDFKPEAEVILPSVDVEVKLVKAKKKTKATAPSKPILINKEVSLDTYPDETPDLGHRNSFSKTMPKDEIEMKKERGASESPKHVHEPEDSKPEVQETSTSSREPEGKKKVAGDLQEKTESPRVVKEESPVLSTTLGHTNETPPGKKKKKSESTVTSAEAEFTTCKKLLDTLKAMALNDDEIQMLIDALLNKQQSGTAEWTKKNDPVAALKKQLQEREHQLEAEQKLMQGLNVKIKELRQELNQEKSRTSTVEHSMREKITQQQQEMQTVHNRMQQSIDQAVAEKTGLQTKIQQLQSKLNEEHTVAIQCLQEEKNQLQQALTRLEAESQNRNSIEVQRLQHEIEQSRSARDQYERRQVAMQQAQDDLHHQNRQLEDHIQQLMNTQREEEFSLQQRLNDLTSKLQQAENTRNTLGQELQGLKSLHSNTEGEKDTLRHQLEEVEQTIYQKDKELQGMNDKVEAGQKQQKEAELRSEELQTQVAELMGNLDNQAQQYMDLQAENESLKSQVARCLENSAADSQGATLRQNGEVSKSEVNDSNVKAVIEVMEHERIMGEKEKQILQVQDELKKHKSDITRLMEEIENQKSKNNELREKNWKAMEAVTAADKAAEEKQRQVQQSAEQKILQIQQDNENTRKQTEHEHCHQLDQVKQSMELRLKEERASVETRLREEHKAESSQLQLKLGELQEALQKSKQQQHEIAEKSKEDSDSRFLQLGQELERWKGEAEKSEDLRLSENAKISEEGVLRLKGEQDRTREVLQRLFPGIKVQDLEDHDTWISIFEKEAIKAFSNVQIVGQQSKSHEEVKLLTQRLEKSTEEKAKVELEVQHYKTVLSETEGMLNKLQSSVEAEEQAWKEKLKTKEGEHQEVLAEKTHLMLEKQRLEASLLQLQGLDEATAEMQTKLVELQTKLQSEESERKILENKMQEANRYNADVKDELECKLKELDELRREKVIAEEESKELEAMKLQLDNQKKIAKDLASQNIKLNSLVKIGQDSLKAETENSKQLQARIQELEEQKKGQGAAANGPPLEPLLQQDAEGASGKK